MGKISKTWRDKGFGMNVWERRKRDPLYKFPEGLFYTTETVNYEGIDEQPVRADRFGIFHLANA